MDGKLAPIEGYKAISNGILSFMARQKVRVPMLIANQDIEKAVEVMLLILELSSFILVDPIFSDVEPSNTDSL